MYKGTLLHMHTLIKKPIMHAQLLVIILQYNHVFEVGSDMQ